jgi:hypothetical protein
MASSELSSRTTVTTSNRSALREGPRYSRLGVFVGDPVLSRRRVDLHPETRTTKPGPNRYRAGPDRSGPYS